MSYRWLCAWTGSAAATVGPWRLRDCRLERQERRRLSTASKLAVLCFEFAEDSSWLFDLDFVAGRPD